MAQWDKGITSCKNLGTTGVITKKSVRENDENHNAFNRQVWVVFWLLKDQPPLPYFDCIRWFLMQGLCCLGGAGGRKREWERNIRPIEWIRPRETIMPMMIGTSLSLGHFYQSSLQSTWAGNDAPAQVAWLKGWPAWYNWITSILKILSRLGYFLSLASNQLLHENQGLIFGSHILRITPRLHRCCMKWVWQLWDWKELEVLLEV